MDKEVTISEASHSTHIRSPKQSHTQKPTDFEPDKNRESSPADMVLNSKPRERL